MTTNQDAEPLEVRLARLAELHRNGVLDDAEFSAAKAALIGSTIGTGVTPQHQHSSGAPADSRVPLGVKRALVGLGGLAVACMSSAFTALQAPAGPFVCSDGAFRAGSTSESFGGRTAFDFDSVCVGADGIARSVSTWALVGMLFVIYAAIALVGFEVLRAIIRTPRRAVVSAEPGSASHPT